MFVDVYDAENLKPKSHHLFHIPNGINYVGKSLACFVTERKHKEVKSTAVHLLAPNVVVSAHHAA